MVIRMTRDTVCMPPRAPTAPQRVRVPPAAWDTHAHVIGAPPRYPLSPMRPCTAPPASVADYLATLEAHGLAYGVLAQVSSHGADNTLLEESLSAYPGRFKGVAIVARDTQDRELERLHAAGVVGVRFLPLGAGPADWGPDLDYLLDLCRERSWHLQLGIDAGMLPLVFPRLEGSGVSLVFDHMVGLTAGDPGIEATFGLLASLRSATDCWVKLSVGHQILVPARPLSDTVPLGRRFAELMPDHVVFGSNWPFVGVLDEKDMPDTGQILDLVAEWAPDEALQRRILVDNPARLYGLPGDR